MKLLHVLPFALAAALAAGCEKTSDIGPMASETRELATSSKKRVEDLERRAERLVKRGVTLNPTGPDVVVPSSLLGESQRRLGELKVALNDAPGRIDAAVKTGKLEELSRYSNRLRTQLDRGELEINANLDAVDAWLTRAETRPAQRVAPPAPAPTPAPEGKTADTPEAKPAEPAAAPAPGAQ